MKWQGFLVKTVQVERPSSRDQLEQRMWGNLPPLTAEQAQRLVAIDRVFARSSDPFGRGPNEIELAEDVRKYILDGTVPAQTEAATTRV